MRSTNCPVLPVLISVGPLPVKAKVHQANLMDPPLLAVMQAKQHRRSVHSRCSAHQTCLLSKITCIAPVVCRLASDFRIFFLRPTNGTIGPGVGSVHLSMLFQDVQKGLRPLQVLTHHFHTATSGMAFFNQRSTASRVPLAILPDPPCSPSGSNSLLSCTLMFYWTSANCSHCYLAKPPSHPNCMSFIRRLVIAYHSAFSPVVL